MVRIKAQSLLEAHALPRASGPRQRTRNPRQRPLGEFLDGEGVFAEGPLSGTRQRNEAVRRRRRWRFLCRGPTLGKEMVFFLNLFAEGRPSANKSFYFFLNLCRGPPLWPSAKKYSGFFKILCRGPALGKEVVFLNF